MLHANPLLLWLHGAAVGLVLIAAGPARADTQFQARPLDSSVPSGKGACEIRVRVQGEAEVSVRAGTIFLHTISGPEARDEGSACNAPLPGRDLTDFHFQSHTKRTQARLLAAPSLDTEYQAKVRVLNLAGGDGHAQFRLTWTLSAGAARSLEGAGSPSDGLVQNNVERFTGRGHGTSSLSGYGVDRLSYVTVEMDRAGGILVSFKTGYGWPLRFAGSVVSSEGKMLQATVTSQDAARLRGPMTLVRNAHGDVSQITLIVTDGQSRLQIDWTSRSNKL